MGPTDCHRWALSEDLKTMRIPTHHDREELRDGRTMTPMIDVVFLLLIFFVCASVGQIREALLPTELAAGALQSQERIEREQPLDKVWVHLRRTGDNRTVVELNDREYADFSALQDTLTQLAKLAPEIPVILDIEPDVPVADVIRVYDTCRRAEFQSINFATEPPSAPSKKP